MLTQITEHVWVYPTDPDKIKLRPAVGAIITPTQTVMYDGGANHAHSRDIVAALRKIDAPPIRYVIYSHVHFDHILGAQIFDAPVIAHTICARRVKETEQLGWSRAYLARAAEERPFMAPFYEVLADSMDWEIFRVVHPSIVFEGRYYTLHLDGVTLELEHVGGEHSDDSIILRVPEDRVMFLADAFYPKPPRLNGANLDMVQGFLDERYLYYVDGHNQIFTHESFTAWKNSPERTR